MACWAWLPSTVPPDAEIWPLQHINIRSYFRASHNIRRCFEQSHHWRLCRRVCGCGVSVLKTRAVAALIQIMARLWLALNCGEEDIAWKLIGSGLFRDLVLELIFSQSFQLLGLYTILHQERGRDEESREVLRDECIRTTGKESKEMHSPSECVLEKMIYLISAE